MSKQKIGAEEQFSLFKNDETRQRWRWVHVAIANAKEANRLAAHIGEEPPAETRPFLRRVR